VDLRTETLSPVEVSSDIDLPEDATVDPDAADPAAEAVRTGSQQVGEAGDDLADLHGRVLSEDGALVALPLTYNDTRYGVLVVYADSPNVLDERELAVLHVLAQFASTAINAIEGRRILTTDRVIEMELAMAGEELFVGEIARQFDCEFDYEGTLYEDDGSVVMLFLAETDDPEGVIEAAESFDRVTEASRVSDGEEGSIFQFVVDTPPVVSALAERGAETTDLTAGNDGVRVQLELPASADPRTVVEHLTQEYPSTELVARHEHERPEQTKRELVADIEESLTARQELALRKAYLGGFFNWPRDTSGEDLANSMDISPSTYHQHLRTAERKVLATLFEG
jgi:predicted DNA binding protein